MSKLGYKQTKEHIKKISESLKGHKHSEETKRKIGEGRIGHKHTEEAKRKIGKGSKGNKYFLGKKHTEETKKKISKSHVKRIKEGRIHPERHGIFGEFYSKKNKKILHYRSQLELYWYQLLEQQTKVKKYQVEPCIIPYQFEGSTKHYLPDLRIVYTDRTSELVEIKPEDEWNDFKNIAKWKAARRWCKTRKRQIDFRVVGYGKLN